ncbi:hypothetical protein L2Y96_09855 [Luteibacter aegosomaticola]|uniref:DUF6587 family protein n=1 Tax=Luteibacter aegosomaticola TaxID=2911538 RepID=UPI001FF8B02F|nr:DUF6587 family protein [Luteibacter aegosomaticola]UPG92044.1 hypothetical protein L2Y96_09855 [Luteibacter aegosomaticola]
MSTFQLVQGVIIGVVVLASLYVAFRKLLPKTSTRVLAGVSASLNHEGRSGVIRAIGKKVQPASATGSCGDGCGSCGTCGPAPVAHNDAQPLTFKTRR